MSENKKTTNQKGSAIVVGGGIGGMQTALDLVEAGIKVHLLEKDPAIGGRMVGLDKTFPTNECAMCVVSPKLVECARHLNIDIITNSDIEDIKGKPGNFTVTINKRPRYIREDLCTGCGACILNCPVKNKINIIDETKEERVELSTEVKSVIDNIITDNRSKKGALMLILQSINSAYKYFSQDVLKYVSQEIDRPLTDIIRIATFYDTFSLTPRGKHTISVCMGTTCYVKGSEKILDRLSDTLDIGIEGTTKDRNFSLKSVRCLGCCSIAPAIMIDDEVYGHLKLNQIQKILKDYK